MEQAYIDAHNWYVKNQQKLGALEGDSTAVTSPSKGIEEAMIEK